MKKIITITRVGRSFAALWMTGILVLCSTTAFAESAFVLDVKQTSAEKTILDEHTVPRVLILKTTPTLLAQFQNLKQLPNQHIAEQLNRAVVED